MNLPRRSAAALRRGWLWIALCLLPQVVAAEEIPAAADGTSVLLLTNGRIVSGRIGQNAGGYVVQAPAGSVLVPFDRIQLLATDVHDAYRRLLKMYPNPSPETHVALARWCLTQQLYEETKIELRATLAADPSHAEARNMLRRLEEILNPMRPRQPAVDGKQQTADGFEQPPATSLARLPGDAALEFVTRVQPLLMNSCALAGCHSNGSDAAFQLKRVRIGPRSSRVLTERNLAATLQYVDHSDPDGSLLLNVPRGNHGRGGRPVFAGSKGDEHFRLLRDWVRRVAPGVPADTDELATQPAFSPSSAPDAARASRAARTEANRQTPAVGASGQTPPAGLQPELQAMPGVRRPAESLDDVTGGDPLLEAILRQERPDAFDPAAFNGQTRQRER